MAKSKSGCCAPIADDGWRARMDCDALIEAEKIKADKARYKAALVEVRKRKEALDEVVEGQAEKMAELLTTGSKKSAG